jgi:hypothetical protein
LRTLALNLWAVLVREPLDRSPWFTAGELRLGASALTDHNVQQTGELGREASTVLVRELQSVAARRPAAVAATLPASSSSAFALAAHVLVNPAFDPQPPPLPAQILVDLLKHPLCAGEARRIILGQLSRHYGRPFADQWDFVRYATDNKLGLDLTSPPTRPDR